MPIKLSLLTEILGLGMAALNVYGLVNPAAFAVAARKFPRSLPVGYVLMLLGTAWFVFNVQRESLADFEGMKPYLCVLFVAVGLGTCIFVTDFLAVRGVAVVLLLLAQAMLDAERWLDTPWRLVIAVWAYLLVVAGMWFTVSPWRLRDLINWNTANEMRTRACCGLRVAFGVFMALLGFTVFKTL
jgi:hypothetical protein